MAKRREEEGEREKDGEKLWRCRGGTVRPNV
jgi:hypothetical protein